MRQIVYAMRFTGSVAPSNGSPSVLKATTTAPGCRVSSRMAPSGLEGTIEPLAGGDASFESQVMFTGEATFQERGSIAFGDGGHRLRFSTVGQGYLGDCPVAGLKHGTVMWQVDDGEGQFAGAHGLITSNFFVGANGEVTDHHFGVLFVE